MTATVAAKPPPAFDPGRPFTEANERGIGALWLQNGWLYRRGSAVPVREVK
jgi:hypothetical protein